MNLVLAQIVVEYRLLMDASTTTLICPNCKKPISVDQALKSQLEDQIKQSLRDEFNQKYVAEIKKKEEQLFEQVQKEKLELEDQLSENKKEIEVFRENELILRKKAQALEEKEKNLELEKQRQIDEERKKIQEKTETEITEKFHLKDKEKDQLIESLKKSLDEAQRKASVGSQQLQGEVMEIELEEILRREFPVDEMSEVKKGARGADLIQLVKDQIGRDVGKIIWESKRTKAFTEDWILKLKEDMREAKADVSVIVTTVLPTGVKFFTQKDGVYITNFDCVLQVAFILRKSLLDIAQTKALSVGKNEKIESLYRYITSSEFAQRIDLMLETYSKMQQTLDKEKMVMQKIWAQRDKEIERLKNNTLSIHGSLSGLIDEPMVGIKSLEFEEIVVIKEADDNK